MKARYEAVHVEANAGVPHRVIWRGVPYQVVEIEDRWRYAGKWWLDGRGWHRTYWVVSARRFTGGTCRTFELFRQGANWVLARESD